MLPRRKFQDWLRVGGTLEPWIYAFLAIDSKNDKSKLIELLNSRKQIPAQARHHLADLLSRYQLKRPRGKQKTPSYTLSEKVARLRWASDSLKEQKKTGYNYKDYDDVLNNTARVYGVTPSALRSHEEGKHSSARRSQKRLQKR